MHSQMKGRIVCDSFLNCIGCCLDARTVLPTTCTPCGGTPPPDNMNSATGKMSNNNLTMVFLKCVLRYAPVFP